MANFWVYNTPSFLIAKTVNLLKNIYLCAHFGRKLDKYTPDIFMFSMVAKRPEYFAFASKYKPRQSRELQFGENPVLVLIICELATVSAVSRKDKMREAVSNLFSFEC